MQTECRTRATAAPPRSSVALRPGPAEERTRRRTSRSIRSKTPPTVHRSFPAAHVLASLLICLFACIATPATRAATPDDVIVQSWLGQNLDGLVALYQELHANPELSLEEEKTAARVAQSFAAAGYEVQTGIGGHGVVGVLRNGPGPTLLIRGDMDALPVTEETGLPYASQVTTTTTDGSRGGVMHACGHDLHVTNLLAVSRFMAEKRDLWSGTLVALAQPAEELGRGALAMMNDGLFERVPRPDATLALHVEPEIPAGQVGLTSGWAAANVDAVDITIHGRGGHGARPHKAIDPITTAAYLITQLQTLVSRRVDPLEPAVLTVGSIHGGHKHNVIPDEVKLQITVRSYSDPTRSVLIEGIRQMTRDTCSSFQCPREAEVRVRKNYTPAVYNDPELTARAARVFAEALGEENIVARKPSMGGEDFGRYSRELGVPGLLVRLGATDPVLYEASLDPGAAPLPSLHSSRFAPLPRTTLETGVRAMSGLALDILSPTDGETGSRP
jgi:amidohydrolase